MKNGYPWENTKIVLSVPNFYLTIGALLGTGDHFAIDAQINTLNLLGVSQKQDLRLGLKILLDQSASRTEK